MSTFDVIRMRFILDKQKFSNGFTEAKKQIKRDTGEMRRDLARLKLAHVRAFREMRDEIPGFNAAMRLVKNPYVAAAAGVAVLYKGFQKTTQAAADFNTQFRQLQNLNIDKPINELNRLKNTVLDTAFGSGFDARKTSAGFFDIQSVTGKYGKEVKEIVRQQGEFAQIMQADFNNWIAGTGKAMANYGFGAKELTDFNKSAFATVKVGVTTFDQLANVMSVYAGGAAASKQTYDTANKLFALFTVKTKSIDEAATLTKSFFNDLTKDTTIKALEAQGIKMYDNNNRLRQADKILLDLNKKFRELKGDKSIISLKNQFTGSEGLIAYIQAATDQTGNLQNTFKAFNDTKFEFDKATELAKNDLNLRTDILKNKLNVLETEIGESLLPLKIKINELKLGVLELIKIIPNIPGYDRNAGEKIATKQYGDLLENAKYHTRADYEKNLNLLHEEIVKSNENGNKSGGFIKKMTQLAFLYKTGSIGFKDLISTYNTLPTADTFYGKATALNNLRNEYISRWKKETNNGDNITEYADLDIPPKNEPNIDDNGITTITGSAKQVRNITVNIDAFNKGGINTQQTNLQHMDSRQIEDWFTEMCLRVVRNLETSY